MLIAAVSIVVMPVPASAQAPRSSTQPANARVFKPDARKAKDAYEQGLQAEHERDWAAAFSSYSDAVNWAPNDREYAMRREVARSRLVQMKMDAAERDAISGRMDDARRELLSASNLDPSNRVVRERLVELLAIEPDRASRVPSPDIGGEVRVNYKPGTENFDYRGDTQGAYDEVARRFGVEVAFDVDLHQRPVRFRISGVDFPTALRLLGSMTDTFWRPLTHRLFFVTDDTSQKRKDYDASVVRTVLLPASETPDQMTEVLRTVREIAGITRAGLDVRSHTLTLRASPRAIAVATDLIDGLEQPRGELILEIDVLDVDRNYARQLGITPPESSKIVTLTPAQLQDIQQNGLQGIIDVINQVFGLPGSLSGLTSAQISSLLGSNQLSIGSLLPPIVAFGGGKTTFLATMPGAAANFSQMLSLVRHGRRILLRAQDGAPATFFVGDRIPVSLATLSNSFAGTGAGTAGISASNFPTTTYAAGNTPSFVTAAVLRSDSTVSDLIVANSADNTISVLLGNSDANGNADGTFGNQVAYPLGATTDSDPVWIATGDFNNDGIVDLAVANKGSNNISIFFGNGDGTFQPATDIAVGISPVSIAAARLNTNSTSNNNIDLAVVNQADNTVSILLGDGTGAFAPAAPATIATGRAPSSVASADLNNDGKIDLAVTNANDNTVSVFLGNGDGTFARAANSPFAVGNSPQYVAIGDFNADGFSDLATANNGAPTADNTGNTVSILLNQLNANGQPTGSFAPPATERDFPAGNGPVSIAVADYNIDGLPDLAVAAQGDNAVSVLLNLGGGLFGPFFELPVGTSPASIATADFNDDSKPDVVTANSSSADLSVILDSSTFLGTTNALGGFAYPGAQYLDIGLKVKATPRIHADSDVTLQLSFEISSLTNQSLNQIPVISTENVEQTVRVKENQTAVLAGFLETQTTNAIEGNPGITDIPGIGLFDSNRNTQQADSELLILVTPRTVRLAPKENRSIYAGQGSLEGPAGGTPAVVQPLQPQQPPAEAQPPGQPQQPPPAPPSEQQPPTEPAPQEPPADQPIVNPQPGERPPR
ncbi:MAG TPA: FG-GAP-like repeat-containing protein [Verrucomicrobiae bacterium]|nr:FG-GAP-like repeat-containing protein [Verrucomicrobiae bacterium]